MGKYLFIVRTFALLREHEPWKLVLIFVLTMLLGVMSGFSIVMLIPLLQLLSIGTGAEPEGIALFINRLADSAGINLTIGSILLVYMVLLTLSALMQYWKSILDARYQQTFIYSLRRRLFRKIIMADWQLLNSRSKTNHLQVLTREVPNLANYYYLLPEAADDAHNGGGIYGLCIACLCRIHTDNHRRWPIAVHHC